MGAGLGWGKGETGWRKTGITVTAYTIKTKISIIKCMGIIKSG